jgi:hypothetical protein
MHTKLMTYSLVSFTIVATVGVARSHEFPAAAKKINASLVQNYAACVAPDTTTGGGTPACAGTTPVDTLCTFPGTGNGKVTLSIGGTAIKAKAKLQGLAPTCEGQTLSVQLGVRVTTDDCPGDHCTVADQALTAGSCTVSGGKCAINGEVSSGYPAGENSGIQIVTCSVGRTGVNSFACGLFVP